MLDMQGVAIAAGAACTTRSMRLPPALLAIGRDTTEAEVDRAIELFAEVTAKLRSMSPVQ